MAHLHIRKIIPFLLAFALLLTGCGSGAADASGSKDASPSKSGTESQDASGSGDAGGTDSGTSNSGNSGSGASDSGNSDSGNAGSGTSGNADSGTAAAIPDPSEMFTERDYEIGYDETESAKITLNGDSASSGSNAVKAENGNVTITDEGSYILTGSLDDGMVIIDAEKTDKLHLILDGASIRSGSSAALYVRQADKVFVTLASGSKNKLSNGGKFTAIDENNIDAAIFSKDDLTLNGDGALEISSPAGHGIACKDDLAITSGTYEITAASQGISGKDSVRISNGTFTIDSGKDGVHAENADDSAKGFLYLAGGTFSISSDGDGMSASSGLRADGGKFTIQADGESAKGVKADGVLAITSGTFSIDSSDDAVHSNASIQVSGGTFAINTGDDGFHADGELLISGGDIQIAKSYEGLEGLSIKISGGKIDLVSDDDGLNAAGGNDGSGMTGPRGGDAFESNPDCVVEISGGALTVNAMGDGIDTNGSLTVSGGETYVSGPTNDGNGALDYASGASITGGTFLAAGSAGMMQNFGEESSQGSILVTFDTQSAGSKAALADSSGKEILSWKPEKEYASLLVSLPEIQAGESYRLSAGDYSEEITMDSLIYGTGSTGGMGGHGGMGRGPQDGSLPDGNVDGGNFKGPQDGRGFGGHGHRGFPDSRDGGTGSDSGSTSGNSGSTSGGTGGDSGGASDDSGGAGTI